MKAVVLVAQLLVGSLLLIAVGSALGLFGEQGVWIGKWLAAPLLIVALITALLQFLGWFPGDRQDRE